MLEASSTIDAFLLIVVSSHPSNSISRCVLPSCCKKCDDVFMMSELIVEVSPKLHGRCYMRGCRRDSAGVLALRKKGRLRIE